MLNALQGDCGASLTCGSQQLLQMDSPGEGCRLEVADPHTVLTAACAGLGEAVN